MTVASNKNREDYTSGGPNFDYTFRIFAETDLVVIFTDDTNTDTTLALNTDYTVSGVGDPSGGKVTLQTGGALSSDTLASGEKLSILRVLPITQKTDLRNQRTFYPEVHEDVFDRLTMIAQQVDEEFSRTIVLPASVDPSTVTPTLPRPEANTFFGWDSTGTQVVNKSSASNSIDLTANQLIAKIGTSAPAGLTLGTQSLLMRKGGDITTQAVSENALVGRKSGDLGEVAVSQNTLVGRKSGDLTLYGVGTGAGEVPTNTNVAPATSAGGDGGYRMVMVGGIPSMEEL